MTTLSQPISLRSRIQLRLLSAFGMIVVLTLVVALIGLLRERATAATANIIKSAELTNQQQLKQSVLSAETAGQAYWLGRGDRFVSASPTVLLNNWQTELNETRLLFETTEDASNLLPLLDIYEESFLNTVALVDEIGDASSGVRLRLDRELANMSTLAANEGQISLRTQVLALRQLEDEIGRTTNGSSLAAFNSAAANVQSFASTQGLSSSIENEFNGMLARYTEAVTEFSQLQSDLSANRSTYLDTLTTLNRQITAEDAGAVTVGLLPSTVAQRSLVWVIVPIMLSALIGFILANQISSQISKQTGELLALFGRIPNGRTDSRAEVFSEDELGSLTNELNEAIEKTSMLVKSDAEEGQMQQSIERLAAQVQAIAAGDLSNEAEVTQDITGSLADAFNFLREQLLSVVVRVQETTLQVSASANEIQTTAEHLTIGSEQQAMQIVNTSSAIDEMSTSISTVSQSSNRSAVIGRQALTTARAGASAVESTMSELERVSQSLDGASQRVTRLQRIAREMADVVRSIEELAERTSILSLNASIQSTAGNSALGFERVAVEIEQLATQSSEATQQIAVIVRSIESDAQTAASAMQTTRTQVTNSMISAEEAGERLNEIELVSENLARLIQQISLAAQQQARGSRSIATAMNAIADGTQQSATGTKQATALITNLAQLAEELRRSVAQFKLS